MQEKLEKAISKSMFMLSMECLMRMEQNNLENLPIESYRKEFERTIYVTFFRYKLSLHHTVFLRE